MSNHSSPNNMYKQAARYEVEGAKLKLDHIDFEPYIHRLEDQLNSLPINHNSIFVIDLLNPKLSTLGLFRFRLLNRHDEFTLFPACNDTHKVEMASRIDFIKTIMTKKYPLKAMENFLGVALMCLFGSNNEDITRSFKVLKKLYDIKAKVIFNVNANSYNDTGLHNFFTGDILQEIMITYNAIDVEDGRKGVAHYIVDLSTRLECIINESALLDRALNQPLVIGNDPYNLLQYVTESLKGESFAIYRFHLCLQTSCDGISPLNIQTTYGKNKREGYVPDVYNYLIGNKLSEEICNNICTPFNTSNFKGIFIARNLDKVLAAIILVKSLPELEINLLITRLSSLLPNSLSNLSVFITYITRIQALCQAYYRTKFLSSW